MKLLFVSLLVILFSTLSSCIEIIDDITVNNDGSGTFKYTVNLSSSKVKINSILSLDSLDGKKVPSISDISSKLSKLEDQLAEQEGISNLNFTSDYTNFIFKINCDFSSLKNLQAAVKEIALKENNGKAIPELDIEWLIFENNYLIRSIPHITIAKASQINKTDTDLMKEGVYTSITRFENEVTESENKSARISKNKKAVMVRTNPYLLIQNPQLLDNTIHIKENAENTPK